MFQVWDGGTSRRDDIASGDEQVVSVFKSIFGSGHKKAAGGWALSERIPFTDLRL
jgi:hypothetical protein